MIHAFFTIVGWIVGAMAIDALLKAVWKQIPGGLAIGIGIVVMLIVICVAVGFVIEKETR